MTSYTLEMEYDIDQFLLVVYNVTWGCPSHTNCLPEDAYPAEDNEVEVTSVKVKGVETSAFDDYIDRHIDDLLEHAACEEEALYDER